MIVSRSITLAHPELEEMTSVFSQLLSGFAIQVENTLIKYGTKIIEHELPQKRIANMAMELYVILATCSRTTSILNDESVPQEKKDYVMKLTKLIFHNARHHFIANLKGMEKPNDKMIREISDIVSENGGYGLDIMDY